MSITSTTAPASLPVIPVVFRAHYDRASRSWSLVAGFPTLAANCSEWWSIQVYDFGPGRGYVAADPAWFAKGRPATAEEVAAVFPMLAEEWANDPDSPARLVVYKRTARRFVDKRRADYFASRREVRK